MSAVASKSLDTRDSLLRTVVLGGMFIFIIQLIHTSIVAVLIQKNPFMTVWQFIASGALGTTAFEGGAATAVLGILLHLIISFIIAGIFILAAQRIPLLRRNLTIGSLLYGIGVFIVMTMFVTPLSAAPPLPAPTLPWLIEGILEAALFIGLPLGILARRHAGINQ